jgi:hypothetical protein
VPTGCLNFVRCYLGCSAKFRRLVDQLVGLVPVIRQLSVQRQIKFRMQPTPRADQWPVKALSVCRLTARGRAPAGAPSPGEALAVQPPGLCLSASRQRAAGHLSGLRHLARRWLCIPPGSVCLHASYGTAQRSAHQFGVIQDTSPALKVASIRGRQHSSMSLLKHFTRIWPCVQTDRRGCLQFCLME